MKVKLKIKLTGVEDLYLECFGIKTSNTIKYLEKDLIVNIKYLKEELIIKRSNSDYQVTIKLNKKKKTISTYEFVGGNKIFNLETKTNKLFISDDKIIAEYSLEGNDFKFILEVIKWENY